MPDSEAVEAFDRTWARARHLPRWRLQLWRFGLQQRIVCQRRDIDLISLSALDYALNHYVDVHVSDAIR